MFNVTSEGARSSTLRPTLLKGHRVSDRVDAFNQDLSVCHGNHVNAYVFPPFSLIGSLLRFLASLNAVVTVVVPSM